MGARRICGHTATIGFPWARTTDIQGSSGCKNHPRQKSRGSILLRASNTLGKATIPRGCLVVAVAGRSSDFRTEVSWPSHRQVDGNGRKSWKPRRVLLQRRGRPGFSPEFPVRQPNQTDRVDHQRTMRGLNIADIGPKCQETGIDNLAKIAFWRVFGHAMTRTSRLRAKDCAFLPRKFAKSE